MRKVFILIFVTLITSYSCNLKKKQNESSALINNKADNKVRELKMFNDSAFGEYLRNYFKDIVIENRQKIDDPDVKNDSSFKYVNTILYETDSKWKVFFLEGTYSTSGLNFTIYGVYNKLLNVTDYSFYADIAEKKFNLMRYEADSTSIEIYGQAVDLFGNDTDKPTPIESLLRFPR